MSSHFSLRSSALGSKAVVAGIVGKEVLNRPYVFDIFIVIPHSNDLDLHDVVSSKATLEWNDDRPLSLVAEPFPPFTYSGVISSFRLLRANRDASLYAARLVPQLWQLSLARHSRIWTQMTFVEVLQEVLEESGMSADDYEFRPAPAAQVEEHIAQYKESNLDFFHRWLEREGFYYFFEQNGEREKLVITSDSSAHAALNPAPIRYHPESEGDRTPPRSFDNFCATIAALPASIRLNDYDYARPNLNLSSSSNVSDQGLGEIADYGHRYFSPDDGVRLAEIRAQEFRAGEVTFYASGNATHLSAGHTFTLSEHPRSTFDIEYLVTEVTHTGRDASMSSAWGSLVPKTHEKAYWAEVQAIDRKVQFRPGMRTPWPRIDGFENAVVDGPATSPYAQIDDQGRYAIKFKFDEGSRANGKASTWVRMMQPHGGSAEGHHFPLRKSTEVLCTFLGGDPDRPVIAGVAHNATTPSMVTRSNHTQNVIQTGGGNRVEMEDAAGGQYINEYSPVMNTVLRLGAPLGGHHFKVHTDGNGGIEIIQNFDIDVVLNSTHHVSSGNHTIDVDSGFMKTTIASGYYQLDVNDYMQLKSKARAHFESTADTGTFKSKANMLIQTNAQLDVKADQKINVESTGNDISIKTPTNCFVEVGAKRQSLIAGDESILKLANEDSITIANNSALTIGNTRTTMIGTAQTLFVGSRTDVTIGSSNITFVGHQDVTFNGGRKTVVHADTVDEFYGTKRDHTFALQASTFVGVKLSAELSASITANATFTLQLCPFQKETKLFKQEEKPMNINISVTHVHNHVMNVNIAAALHVYM